jgi:hypothetical protein
MGFDYDTVRNLDAIRDHQQNPPSFVQGLSPSLSPYSALESKYRTERELRKISLSIANEMLDRLPALIQNDNKSNPFPPFSHMILSFFFFFFFFLPILMLSTSSTQAGRYILVSIGARTLTFFPVSTNVQSSFFHRLILVTPFW